MDQLTNFYYENSTSISLVLFCLTFILLNFFYLIRKKGNYLKRIAAIFWYWFPFILTIIILLILDHFKGSIISCAENKHKVEIQNKWYFILLSIANNLLLLSLTLSYILHTFKLCNFYFNFTKLHRGNLLVITCSLSSLINIFVLFYIYKYVKNEETSFNVLVLTQIASIINMILFFIIDLIVCKLANQILVIQQINSVENRSIKAKVIDFKKTASFAIFNIDLACLLGVVVVTIIQNKFLNISDTIYEYPFAIGSVFFQIVITQIIFALYQSKRLTNKTA